jgi:hypothetical protein
VEGQREQMEAMLARAKPPDTQQTLPQVPGKPEYRNTCCVCGRRLKREPWVFYGIGPKCSENQPGVANELQRVAQQRAEAGEIYGQGQDIVIATGHVDEGASGGTISTP